MSLTTTDFSSFCNLGSIAITMPAELFFRNLKEPISLSLLVLTSYGNDQAILKYILAKADQTTSWERLLQSALSRLSVNHATNVDYDPNLPVVYHIANESKLDFAKISPFLMRYFLEQTTGCCHNLGRLSSSYHYSPEKPINEPLQDKLLTTLPCLASASGQAVEKFLALFEERLNRESDQLNYLAMLLVCTYGNDQAILKYILTKTSQAWFNWEMLLEACLERQALDSHNYNYKPNLTVLYHILNNEKIVLSATMGRILLGKILEQITGHQHDDLVPE